MFLAILFLAFLFIAGLVFHFPSLKIHSWLPFFFPNISYKTTTSSTANSKKEVSNNNNNGKRKEELRKVFATFDKNGDGFITRQELRESLRNIRIFISDKEIDDIVVNFDSNGDGLIDFDEFCLLTSEVGGGVNHGEKGEAEEEEEEDNLKEAFDVFDKDRDGVISVEELALVLTSLGLREGMKIEECKEMIRKVDMDGDGRVDFQEFKRMMKGGKLVLAA